MEKIAVIGLGYVGLPLALHAESKGFEVTGVDLDSKILAKLAQRRPTIDDRISNELIKNTSITFTNDFSKLRSVSVAIVCVPTPVSKEKVPDLSNVKNASISAAKYLSKESLLIIESTINPGVCEEVIIPAIESSSEHIIGKTLHIAHCPERINPGDTKWHVGNINRVLGANSYESLQKAYDFYSTLIDAKVKKMNSLKEAEACKVVENSFRDINIAFVNELAMSFDKLGINVNNVIEGAATKPFAFMAHFPGIGVGGHCIPVDPYYLIEYARNNGFNHRFLSLARSINESMPVYSVDLLEKALMEKANKSLKDSRVTVLGLSYKANVGDERESPSYAVIKALSDRGAMVTTYDPYIIEKSTAKTLIEAVQNQDAVILATSHKEFIEMNTRDIKGVTIFLDGRNAFTSKRKELAQQDIHYLGIGI